MQDVYTLFNQVVGIGPNDDSISKSYIDSIEQSILNL